MPAQACSSRQLSEYVAASVVLHCLDGWSYLANAVGALLDGEQWSAIHMAYYAELRAAMSFLASDGIGVFNFQHCWVDNQEKGVFFNGQGTHRFVWDAVERWAQEPVKSTRLLELFRVHGTTFTDWLKAAGYGAGGPIPGKLAHDWLLNWSIDLKEFTDDRDLRNEMSYRPQRLHHQQQRQAITVTLTNILELWRSCEPATSDRFSMLDIFLLRLALEDVYRTSTGWRPHGLRYIRHINRVFANLGFPTIGFLYDFLIKKDLSSQNFILSEARRPGMTPKHGIRPLSVISRALLLLRLASAAASDLLSYAAISSSEIAFWTDQLGLDIGLWDMGAAPASIVDLWSDIEAAIGAVSNWCDLHGAGASVLQARKSLGGDITQLKQFQRVGLWGIGL